ncbi:MAG: PEP-CTERM sorting domain-containing protein [Planctomycetota bacterium]
MTQTTSPTRITRRACGFVAAAGLAAGIASTAAAAPIAYEGFDYTAGGDLSGLSGGTGFDEAWNDPGAGDNNYVVTTPGLTYGNLLVSGNAVTYSGPSNGGNYQTTRSLSGSFNTFAEGSQNWLAFLIDPASSVADAGVSFGPNSLKVEINNSNLDISSFGGNLASVDISGDLLDGGNLVIAKVSKTYAGAAPLTTEVWFNPTDFSSEVALGTPTLTAVQNGTNFAYDFINIQSNFFLGQVIDEIRVANDSFEGLGLAVIPEPASLALLGLGGFAMLGRRRKA